MKCDICGREIHHRYTGSGRNGEMTFCKKHYDQYKKYGHALDNNPRTIYDPNETHIVGPITYIDLYNEDCVMVARAVIDTEDLVRVKDYKWRLSLSGYVVANGPNKSTVHLHRLIINADDDMLVDHINHDKLCNRKSNLREVTKGQNQMNSNSKGVYFDKRSSSYKPYIKINQRMISFKGYKDENEALLCRWFAEAMLFREFRYPKQKPNIGDSKKEEQIFLDTNRRLLGTMPIRFVTNTGIECFVDERYWLPYHVDIYGITHPVNQTDGHYYYNSNNDMVQCYPGVYFDE